MRNLLKVFYICVVIVLTYLLVGFFDTYFFVPSYWQFKRAFSSVFHPTSNVTFSINFTIPTWSELQQKYASDAFWNDGFMWTEATASCRYPLSPVYYDLPVRSLGRSVIWAPHRCVPITKIAVIIAYRNRSEHLRVLMNNLPAFLCRQKRYFAIFVVEQFGNVTFNRAALFNVGYRESKRVDDFDCFIFHDVDMIPEDNRLPYRCGSQPIHLAVELQNLNYKLYYETYVGGVIALSREQFIRIRGFSNYYYGWGGEDDDLYKRIYAHNYSVFRHVANISRYATLVHERDKGNEINPRRFTLLQTAKSRMDQDGFPETTYTVNAAEPKFGGLVYWISVEIPMKMSDN